MTRPDYALMLAEHAEVATAAERIVEGFTGEASLPPTEAYSRRCPLAALVEDHFENEEVAIAGLVEVRPKGQGADRWREGRSGFERLNADRLAFPDRWTRDASEADFAEFRLASTVLLRRLLGRLDWGDTHEFYAAALQTGVVALKG